MNTVDTQELENGLHGAVLVEIDRWVLSFHSLSITAFTVCSSTTFTKQLFRSAFLLSRTVLAHGVVFESVPFKLDDPLQNQGNRCALRVTEALACDRGILSTNGRHIIQRVKRLNQRCLASTLKKLRQFRSLFVQLPLQQESGA